LSAIIALYLLFRVLRHFVPSTASWYPLTLLATGYIYLYYATELKQYASDTAIALVLILLALEIKITTLKPSKFIVLWAVAALLGMWFSMPSVFILAGIGGYYFYPAYKDKSAVQMRLLAVVAACWVACFVAFYFLVLKAGIGSEDLKAYHAPYFIKLIPLGAKETAHTMAVLSGIMGNAAGETAAGMLFNSLLFFAGIFFLFRRYIHKALLLLVPVIGLYIAAGMQQFTLLPRVVMFIMPVLLVIIAVGFDGLFNIPNIIPKIALVLLALVNIKDYNKMNHFYEPLLFEEMRDALYELRSENISPEHFHVNALLEPAIVYYTTIHPDKDDWAGYDNAYVLPWTDDYDPVTQSFSRDAVLYGWYPQDRLNNEFASYAKYCNLKKIDVYGMQLYICTAKPRRSQ
jgi:hypothetical protein